MRQYYLKDVKDKYFARRTWKEKKLMFDGKLFCNKPRKSDFSAYYSVVETPRRKSNEILQDSSFTLTDFAEEMQFDATFIV